MLGPFELRLHFHWGGGGPAFDKHSASLLANLARDCDPSGPLEQADVQRVRRSLPERNLDFSLRSVMAKSVHSKSGRSIIYPFHEQTEGSRCLRSCNPKAAASCHAETSKSLLTDTPCAIRSWESIQ